MMSRENSKHFWTRKGLKDKLPETFTKNDIRLLKPTFVVLLVRHDQLLILEQPLAWVCETVTSGKSCFKIKTSIYKRTVKFTYCLTRLWSGLNYFDLNNVFLVVSLFSIQLKLIEQLTENIQKTKTKSTSKRDQTMTIKKILTVHKDCDVPLHLP